MRFAAKSDYSGYERTENDSVGTWSQAGRGGSDPDPPPAQDTVVGSDTVSTSVAGVPQGLEHPYGDRQTATMMLVSQTSAAS
jgi:hypothetical protein